MSPDRVFEQVVAILKPFAKSPEGLAKVSNESNILTDLKVNSARLVDVVLEIEDTFGIQVTDDDADSVKTVGDAVRLVLAKAA